jgi:hypothetical protein
MRVEEDEDLSQGIQDDYNKQNFDTPSLERVLRGRVCYNLLQCSSACSLGMSGDLEVYCAFFMHS